MIDFFCFLIMMPLIDERLAKITFTPTCPFRGSPLFRYHQGDFCQPTQPIRDPLRSGGKSPSRLSAEPRPFMGIAASRAYRLSGPETAGRFGHSYPHGGGCRTGGDPLAPPYPSFQFRGRSIDRGKKDPRSGGCDDHQGGSAGGTQPFRFSSGTGRHAFLPGGQVLHARRQVHRHVSRCRHAAGEEAHGRTGRPEPPGDSTAASSFWSIGPRPAFFSPTTIPIWSLPEPSQT